VPLCAIGILSMLSTVASILMVRCDMSPVSLSSTTSLGPITRAILLRTDEHRSESHHKRLAILNGLGNMAVGVLMLFGDIVREGIAHREP